eukprot:6206629-Pleurochrysis_carterae.AAC.4
MAILHLTGDLISSVTACTFLTSSTATRVSSPKRTNSSAAPSPCCAQLTLREPNTCSNISLIALKADHGSTLVTFAQCALGAAAQKYASLLVTPGISPSLVSLSSLRCQHTSHPEIAGGSKTSDGWASRRFAAYPPDFNFLLAKVIGTHCATHAPTGPDPSATPHAQTPPVAMHKQSSARDPALPPRSTVTRLESNDVAPDASPAPTASSAPPLTSEPRHLRRALGEYPLRSRRVIRSRSANPRWGRGTGCAFAINHVSADPRTRKQAMAEDQVGWGAAERAEIDNHASNGS